MGSRAGNRGARSAGVDGVQPRDILFGTDTVLLIIPFPRDDLEEARFVLVPVREQMIPKASSNLWRLGIPSQHLGDLMASLPEIGDDAAAGFLGGWR